MATKPQYDPSTLLNSANALVRDVIVETERIVNTPTKEWTVSSRQCAMQALSIRAGTASAVFSEWIEQNIWIKNMGKIRGSFNEIQMDARMASTANSRKWGRAHLKGDLEWLVEVFGSGCEFENQVSTGAECTLAPPPDQKVQQETVKKPRVDPEERPYTLRELAILHGVSYMTVSRWYENEQGVLVAPNSADQQRKSGRRYRTIRVPRHVYHRVRRRMENR